MPPLPEGSHDATGRRGIGAPACSSPNPMRCSLDLAVQTAYIHFWRRKKESNPTIKTAMNATIPQNVHGFLSKGRLTFMP